MRPVRVNKNQLLEAVRKNRDQHRAIFLQALEGYRAEALRQLNAMIRQVKASKRPPYVAISLYVPEDHTKDYDNAIAMIEMSVDAELEVDEHSFNQLVRDDWEWKRQWLSSNAMYSEMAMRESDDQQDE